MTSKSHNVLFIFRAYNDLDHMTPIIYQALLDKDFHPTIACMDSDFNIKTDFRLKFLKSKFGISARYIYQIHKPSILHHMYSLFVCVLPKIHIFNSVPVIKQLVHKIKNKFQDLKIYNNQWFIQYCETSNIHLIVVDCVPERRYLYNSVAGAKELNIPIFGTPHGLNLIDNDIWDNKSVIKGAQESEWSWIDHIAVASERTRQQYINNGLLPESLTTLGSARFCSEWSSIYDTLIGSPDPIEDSRLMVVYMDHSVNYRMNIHNVIKTLESISKLPNVDLVIKPHTRFNLSDERMRHIGRIDDSHSNHLIKQASIVITAFSSIGLEALKNNTILMYPSFFCDNIPVWARYNACIQVDSVEETLHEIKKIRDSDGQVPYSVSNVEALLKNEVYGGNLKHSILSAYTTYMRTIIQSTYAEVT